MTAWLLLSVGKLAYLGVERGSLRPGNLSALIAIAVVIGISWLVMHGIYRGRKWALWLITVPSLLVLLSVGYLPRQLELLQHWWEKIIYVSQGVLQISAAVMLILPSSWRWFYPKKQD